MAEDKMMLRTGEQTVVELPRRVVELILAAICGAFERRKEVYDFNALALRELFRTVYTVAHEDKPALVGSSLATETLLRLGLAKKADKDEFQFRVEEDVRLVILALSRLIGYHGSRRESADDPVLRLQMYLAPRVNPRERYQQPQLALLAGLEEEMSKP